MPLNSGNVTTIAVDGPATLAEVTALRERFREALRGDGDLIIDLGGSGKWDIAGLQLLVSCVNSGRSVGRSVKFKRVPSACLNIADRAGLGDWLNSLAQ